MEFSRHFAAALSEKPFYPNQYSIYFRYADINGIHSKELYNVWSPWDEESSREMAWKELDYLLEKDVDDIIYWLNIVLDDKYAYRELTIEQQDNIRFAIEYLTQNN